MAYEREKREQDPEGGWTGRMHDPTLRPGEHGDAPEAAAPGGSSQGAADIGARGTMSGGAAGEGEPGVSGSGLEGATASDDERPAGASPPA